MKFGFKFWGTLFALCVILFQSSFIVEQTEQAIVLQFGKVVSEKVLESGLHFKIPFLQKAVFFEKRVLGFCSDQREAITSDQKRLVVDSCSKYVIENPLLFFQTVRDESNLADRLSPLVESRTREVIANVTLNCFIGECREKSASSIKNSLDKLASSFGIQLVDIRLKNISLPKENLASLYLRMISDRKKEATEIRAMGEQEKVTMVSTADKESEMTIADAKRKAADITAAADAEVGKIFVEGFSKNENSRTIGCYNYIRFMQAYDKFFDSSSSALLINIEDNEYLKFLLKNKG